MFGLGMLIATIFWAFMNKCNYNSHVSHLEYLREQNRELARRLLQERIRK